jgi:uncharacterized protein involved in exopolysaccharide biosynthesis
MTMLEDTPANARPTDDANDPIDWGALFAPVWPRWRLLAAAGLAAAAAAVGATYLMTPMFESTTTVLPPQQQQSTAASALASLGALTGIGGSALIPKSPADEYVSLMQSVTATDRIIDQFKLMSRYEAKYRAQARKKLLQRSQIVVGKKDGIISITVSDRDPAVAAAMANQYVEELRRLTTTLAVSEAQQRRMFFERQMEDAKDRLTKAQETLQGSGISAGALKADPKAAAEEYGTLRAQVTASEVRLATLSSTLAPSSAAVQRETATLNALRARLAQLERSPASANAEPDYVGKYREFKYQETLFDLMAKQYEIARVDESREGALIQVVDKAQPAEFKSWPRRAYFAIGGMLAGLLLSAAIVMVLDPDGRRARRSARN